MKIDRRFIALAIFLLVSSACRSKSPEHLKELIKELDSSDGHTRNAAALAIASYGEAGKPAVSSLIRVLNTDKSRGIRTSAAYALRQIGGKEAVGALDNYKD